MTVAELMTYALRQLNEDDTTVTELGWTPKYWTYSVFKSYTLKSIRDTARDTGIELKPLTLTATVFYDTELDAMPALDNDLIIYRLYPLPNTASDDSASEAYFYIKSDSYEPKSIYYDGVEMEIKTISEMDHEHLKWREDVGTPYIAVVEGVTQSTTGSTTPDHSTDYTITSTVMPYQGFATDSVEILLPEKLEDALVYNICWRALSQIGIEEDLVRASLFESKYREEIRRYDIDNLSGKIPQIKGYWGFT